MQLTRKAEKKTATVQFTRLVVFLNPNSTRNIAARKRLEEVKVIMAGLPYDVIETSSEGLRANMRLVEENASKLGPQTLLCIAAGDGTINHIIQALLRSERLSAAARLTPILPLWGGNANDLAHMLNGPGYRAHLHDIITKGHVVPIHPLECDMSSKGHRRIVRIAACYAGFGATALVAHRLNMPGHRQSRLNALPGGRLLQEVITVITTLLAVPAFSIKREDGIKNVYEISFYNGSRMAKVEHIPVQLTDEMFYLNALKDKRILFLLPIPRFVEVTQKRIAQKLLRSYETFTTQEESWAQFDGEPLKIPAGTKIQMQLSTRPFYAVSTILHPESKK
jgi:diacylglycerol kinase family enzyme